MEKSALTTRREMLCFALLAVLMWASNYVIVRFLVPYFSPIAQTTLRYGICAVLTLLLGIIKKVPLPKKKDLPLIIAMSLSGYSFFSLVMVMGARTVTASVSSFMLALTPVAASLFALLFLKERMAKIKWIALGISATGVVILLFSDSSFTVDFNLILILFASILFAIYTILQRMGLRHYSTLDLTVYAFVTSGIVLLPLLPQCLGDFVGIGAIPLAFCLLLGLFTLLSMLLWTMALKRATHVGSVSNFMFLTPILTTILAALTMGEYPPTITYFGGAFMLLGLLLSNVSPKDKTNSQATLQRKD